MPPAKRAPAKKTAPVKAASKPVERVEADLCGLCWPQGWPEEHDNASCEHGRYNR